jgi:hypothetical protein
VACGRTVLAASLSWFVRQCLCNYLTILLHVALLFYKIEWKMKNESADTSDKKCRSHKLNTIETKLEIIRRAESGESLTSVGRSVNLSQSTVYSVVKEKDKIKDHARNAGNMQSTIMSKRRGAVIEKMERS